MVVSNEGTSLYFGGLNHQNDEDEDIASMDFGVKIIKDLDDEKLWATFGKKKARFYHRRHQKVDIQIFGFVL